MQMLASITYQECERVQALYRALRMADSVYHTHAAHVRRTVLQYI